MQLANLIQRRTTFGLTVQPADLAAEFVASIEEELDFTIEAGNAIALREALEGFDRIRIPMIYGDLSTGRILTEEFVNAPSITDDGPIEAVVSIGPGLRVASSRHSCTRSSPSESFIPIHTLATSCSNRMAPWSSSISVQWAESGPVTAAPFWNSSSGRRRPMSRPSVRRSARIR